ncbi:hypothetical protein [Photobacterium leiognathi]|uniref:hypothetical protein n=1 Tax=Photobacterium leiognathi TaxID=553611 RepID=UPI0029829364|nr:hypothetical protein [Photobacterium leiognathi]
MKLLATYIDVDGAPNAVFIDAESVQQGKEKFLAFERKFGRNFHGLEIKPVDQVSVITENFELEEKPLFLLDINMTADSISDAIGAEYSGIVENAVQGVAEPHNFDVSGGWLEIVLDELKSQGLEQLIGQRVYENALKIQAEDESNQ